MTFDTPFNVLLLLKPAAMSMAHDDDAFVFEIIVFLKLHSSHN
jgi:hypothetical protein